MSDTPEIAGPAAEQDKKDEQSKGQSKSLDNARPEISGVAIARMMGVATGTEIKLLEGKLDLMSGRLNNITVKLDRLLSQFSGMPTGSDLERIDIQIGSLKTLIRDVLFTAASGQSEASGNAANLSETKTQETQIIDTEQAEVGSTD